MWHIKNAVVFYYKVFSNSFLNNWTFYEKLISLHNPFKFTLVPRVNVILVAQVFNGCLLPFFAICLLVCLNDQKLMAASPQSTPANCFLFTSVTITMFLAANVFLQKLFGSLMTGVGLKMGLALAASGVGMLAVCIFTTLGEDIIKSHRARRQLNNATN